MTPTFFLPFVATLPAALPAHVLDPQDDAARQRTELERLQRELADLRAARDADRARLADLEARQKALLEAVESKPVATATPSWVERLRLGGYGEIHWNRENGAGGDQIDNHRFVAYLGYRFSDSIELHSETELEHSFVEEGNGELALEQLFVDFRLDPSWNVRAGRFLTPLGIVNETHEPTTFHGVERSLFDTVVIPTTWSSDGVGLFGELSPTTTYELYLGSSLDGSGFDSLDGIRGGRQEERPGISQMALSGRVDWRLVQEDDAALRVGLSAFGGGLDNGNQGTNPGVDADLWIGCVDVRGSTGSFDFRGAYAYEHVQGARDLGPGVASAIDGLSVEAAWHVLRPGEGREHDVALFARYDAVDTQKDLPSGVARDPRGERDEWTVGVTWLPLPSVVIKADYQMRDDDGGGLPERVNLGLGWSF
ncbi:MAG: hypothetical protein U1F29_03835 [Planctomycetota bacterium]